MSNPAGVPSVAHHSASLKPASTSSERATERIVVPPRQSIYAIEAAGIDRPHHCPRKATSAADDCLAAILVDRSRAGIALNDADLPRVSLPGATLVDLCLAGANLAGANLAGANLSDCNLADAILAGANLRGANLSEANLAGTNLGGADLTGATLDGARLVDCNLVDTDITDVDLSDTTLARAQGIIDAGWPDGMRCLAWKHANQIMVFLGGQSAPFNEIHAKIEQRREREAATAIDYLARIATLRGWR